MGDPKLVVGGCTETELASVCASLSALLKGVFDVVLVMTTNFWGREEAQRIGAYIASTSRPRVLISCGVDGVFARGWAAWQSPGAAIWGMPVTDHEAQTWRPSDHRIAHAEGVAVAADIHGHPCAILLAERGSHALAEAYLTGLAGDANQPRVAGGFVRHLSVWIDGAEARMAERDQIACVLFSPVSRLQVEGWRGSRCVGEWLRITSASGNIVSELDGQGAVDRLAEAFNSIDLWDAFSVRKHLAVRRRLAVGLSSSGGSERAVPVVRVDRRQNELRLLTPVHSGDRLRPCVTDDMLFETEMERVLAAPPSRSILGFVGNGRAGSMRGLQGDAERFEALALEGSVGCSVSGEVGPLGVESTVNGFSGACVREVPSDDGRFL